MSVDYVRFVNMNMKALFCLLVLIAVVTVQGAVVNPSARASLNVGAVIPGNRLLSRSYLYRPPVANRFQTEDFTYRGNATIRISAIQALELGYTQYATIWVVAGGLNQANVTLRAQTQRGGGYYYLIDIWGR